jgi:hypothetical protein
MKCTLMMVDDTFSTTMLIILPSKLAFKVITVIPSVRWQAEGQNMERQKSHAVTQ